jgi:hypothetical protein
MKKERKETLLGNLKNSKNIFLKTKKAQFYLIAAAIIIAVLIALTSTSHLVTTKNNQPQVELTVDRLNYEAINLVNYNLYQSKDADDQIEELGELFSQYIDSSSNEQFGLYIFSGEAPTPGNHNINGKAYIQKSSGGVAVDNMDITQNYDIQTEAQYSNIFTGADGKNYMNITISEVTYTAPVSENNFMIVLTTSDGFNTYVATELQK